MPVEKRAIRAIYQMRSQDLLTQILHQNDGQQRSDLNISDVIEAISIADPAADMARSPAHAPFVRIVEQPASKAIRFRYECEGRSAGSIPGVNSNGERRTYPTIEISGCTGKALVVVSCVTRDEPYRPHPHNLVGREHCRSGVCTVKADLREGAQVTFSNLGIQCVKRRDIVEALKTRERLRVDPFRTGFAHVNQPQSIDLNAVRLCFQVFLDDDAGKFRHPLPAVVSDVIFDKKAMSDLHILRTSQPSGPAAGGNDVILLCEKVNREDIAVVVYEEGQEPLEQNANLIIIHKQVAIAFTMPAHRDPQVEKHVDVFIQLKRPSDNARSNSVPYQYIPAYQAEYLEKKRRKTAMPVSIIEQIEQETAKWNQEQKIKTEPAGSSPRRYTPLESAGEYPYHQQWPQEMPGATMPGPYYGQEAPWQGQPFAAPAQTMQGPRLSPNMQATTTQGQMSPQRKVISPHGRVVSPHGQLMSPQGHVMSPQGHVMSPQGHVMSPQGHVMSPQGHVMSPQGHVMSPQGHVMSPQGHVMSPQHQAMSPNHPAMSPHHQALSPQGQMMSPQGQMMSPHGQMMSPQGQVISPQAGQVEVPGDRCGAAQMEHVSRNIDAMAQQAMAFAQAQQQAMDTNSESFSLTSLLAQGEPMQTLQNYSGDLSGYLGPAQHGADLSDSLTRLSTSDLLS